MKFFNRQPSQLTDDPVLIGSQQQQNRFKLQRKYLLLVTLALLLFGGASATAYYKFVASDEKPAVSGPVSNNSGTSSATPATTPDSSSSNPVTSTDEPTSALPSSTYTIEPALTYIVTSINQKLEGYGVTATLTPENNQGTYSTWSQLSNKDIVDLQIFSTYLTEEFSKYPKDLVKNSGLKTIGIVKGLAVSGTNRSAVPVPSLTSVVYDAPLLAASGSKYSRNAISHEYWHYLEYRMTGTWSSADSQWVGCNPYGFKYGSGGASAYNDPHFYNGFHPAEGFITTYSLYAVEEDRAELFGWLIYDPYTVKNIDDFRITCKINRMTDIVRQLSPTFSF